MSRAARDRGAAFHELYARIAPGLYVWASMHIRAPLRKWLDPDDVVQEVWLRALSGFDRYESGRAGFRSWIFGIAHNVLLSQLRSMGDPRSSRPAALTLATSRVGEIPVEATSILERVSRREEVEAVVGFVEALDEPDRSIILLRGLEGLPHAQVASRLDLTEAATESRWRRLRERLGQCGNVAGLVFPG